MAPLHFTEWCKLPVNLGELCINTTLRCGQSFRWQQVPDKDEWRCVLRGQIFSLRQDHSHLYYRTYAPCRSSNGATPTPASAAASIKDIYTPSSDAKDPSSPVEEPLAILHHYLNLSSNLTELYSQWSSLDYNFKKKAPKFTGIRILRQDAWEALICFICSSNNNIARISQMVGKICTNYGPFIGKIDGHAYHDFPPPEALTGDEVEGRLRELGFGYRAKYIYQTATMVAQERDEGWLDSLRNPEYPVFGVAPRPCGQMRAEGRQGYREAHQKLLELQGVGPKVADCVCLMGLGWGEAVPVDTHVWQIAQRDYKFGKGGNKSLTRATYDAVGNHFRKLWGKEAGWAHSVLFTADLRTFSERLVSKVDVKVEKEKEEQPQIRETSTMGVKRPSSEDASEKDRESKDEILLEAHETKEITRRTSKRLKKR